MASYQVLGERIVVAPDPAPKEIGSIAVAETIAMIPTTGTILQVGPEVRHYEPGFRVAFAERAGTLVKVEGEMIRILTPDEILCVLPEVASAS